MVSILSLWLPILLSGVLVFLMSSVFHMLLSYHRSDFVGVPNEDQVMSALGAANIPPGDYFVPHASDPKMVSDPAFIEKYTKGPVAIMTVLPPGPPTMTNNLIQWFLYSIFVGILTAYITGRVHGAGAEYLDVFRLSGTMAFACYSVALLQGSIWYRRKWSSTFKSMFDGLIYALLTAGCFGWLWPEL